MNINGHEIKPGANLRDADLKGADLGDADLTSANLKGANVKGTILEGEKNDKDLKIKELEEELENYPMSKSKFFTDCTNHHTFSLDHVVAISKRDRYTHTSPFELLGYQIKITLLICDKEKQDLTITFLPDKEDERDAEFKRLCRALSKTTS